ncbi:hypothetical protein [Streptomyces sp. GQFP]|uniref:hypothetical protein n=1 Tax=Streptomyces sp. GQFP TaxID=2907545 RepID=UPI001F1B8FB1|nr:hypothetical protein [Streptomyces sp. GQFP]UIX33945.1 hypothetical protein LUX31_30275 [Streptomyces sp. GQFP]
MRSIRAALPTRSSSFWGMRTERAALEQRWGASEITVDDFAEWFCFSYGPPRQRR